MRPAPSGSSWPGRQGAEVAAPRTARGAAGTTRDTVADGQPFAAAFLIASRIRE